MFCPYGTHQCNPKFPKNQLKFNEFNDNYAIVNLFMITYFIMYTGVSKGTDTFQSFVIKKLDNLGKFFSYHVNQY